MDGEVASALKNMRSASDIANQVVHGLLDFCRLQKIEKCDSSIDVTIERALLLMRYEIAKHKVEVRKQIPADLPQVAIDRLHVEQVFINLIVNALHAMPDGGTLTITAKTGERSTVCQSDPADDKTVLLVTVEDSGPGIPDDKLAHVFEPFFSTKPASQGTGLGLPIARSTMELHGGAISICNGSGGGAKVTLIFNT
jgi:signal transduction histidine kinase